MSPRACPRIVLRGLEASARGEKKKRYAVGPSDGKTNGLPVITASRASSPIVTKPLMNTYAARTRRGEKCSKSHSSRSFASNSLTWWKLLDPPLALSCLSAKLIRYLGAGRSTHHL